MQATLPSGIVPLPPAVPVGKIVIVKSCATQYVYAGPPGLSPFSIWFVPAHLSSRLREMQILQLKRTTCSAFFHEGRLGMGSAALCHKTSHV